MRIRRLHVVAALALACVATQAAARPQHQNNECFIDEYSGGGKRICTVATAQPRATGVTKRAAKPKPSHVVEGAGLGSPIAAIASAGGDLLTEARRYLGTNPTGRRSLWCGAFMDLVLKRTGHRGGGNLALAYAGYGRRVSGPQVGAIAVMTRKGGGHVGVVAGVDRRGNVIVVSGNHNNTVAEAVYPRSRVIAYVVPSA